MSTIHIPPATDRAIHTDTQIWQRRFFIVMVTLGWLAIAIAIIWGIGRIITPLVLLGFSALIAYLIFPLVRFFERHMPRVIAILVSMVLVVVIIALVVYFIVLAAIQQFGLLINTFQRVIQHPDRYPAFQTALDKVKTLGVTQQQASLSGQQIVRILQEVIGGIIPLLSNIFIILLAVVLIATFAVYFIIDGHRIARWFRTQTPLKYRGFFNTLLDELDHSVGGFVRGQVLLAVIMSVVVGLGAFFIGVPYVFLLVLIVFLTEFIPQIGPYISGTAGCIFALTQSWQTALIYVIFSVIVQTVLDGQILAPRILGQSVGLHPITSMFAMLVGTVLFGLLGAFFACPAAAILQDFVRSFWHVWRERHPDQFPVEEQPQTPMQMTTGSGGHDQPAVST